MKSLNDYLWDDNNKEKMKENSVNGHENRGKGCLTPVIDICCITKNSKNCSGGTPCWAYMVGCS